MSLLLLLLVALLAGALAAAACGIALQAASPKARPVDAVPGEQRIALPTAHWRLQERGSGPDALVFLHGFNGQLADWNGVWKNLEGCARVLRVDLPGFGGSRAANDDFTLAAQAQRLYDLLDARGIERAVLVGTSMGGSLAAWFAAHEPRRVRALLLLAPSGWPDSLHYDGLLGLIVKPGFANRWAHQLAASTLYRAAFPNSRALQATSVTSSYGAPWAAALARIEAPTLLLWSRGDSSFHAAENTARAIPVSRLLPLAVDAGHLLAATRPALGAAAACALARGASLEQAQAALTPLLAARGDQ